MKCYIFIIQNQLNFTCQVFFYKGFYSVSGTIQNYVSDSILSLKISLSSPRMAAQYSLTLSPPPASYLPPASKGFSPCSEFYGVFPISLLFVLACTS